MRYKYWENIEEIDENAYTCGHCGNKVGSDRGYRNIDNQRWKLYICPSCEKPTFFDGRGQYPGAPYGTEVSNLPEDIALLFREARDCIKSSLYNASVLTARKLLMHIAVDRGADEDMRFIEYVQYLAKEGFVPPGGQGWVDHIRQMGNEANHEIQPMDREDAEELVTFLEMLLKFVYEFPNRIPNQQES